MRALLVLVALLTPATASAFEIRSSTVADEGFAINFGGQLYIRGRGRRPDGGETRWSSDLQRARLKTRLSYGDWIRVDIEPDFGGANADLADAYLQVMPTKELSVRVGQHKAPFGVLELESRWRMPVLTRGLVSEVVSDRLGFGRRKFGARVRWRDKSLPLKPDVQLGAYGPQGDEITEDLAALVRLRLAKKLYVAVTGYSRRGAATDDRRGNFAAVFVSYDRKGWYAAGEVQLGRVKLLSATGLETGLDATMFTARGVVGRRFEIVEDFEVEPFLAGDLIDPNASTRDDIAVAFRLGFNAHWRERLRIGAEWGRNTGQVGAIVNPSSALILFLGTSLD